MKHQPSQKIFCGMLGKEIPEERCEPTSSHYCRECPHSSKPKKQQIKKIIYHKLKPKKLDLFGDLANSHLPEKLKEVFKTPYTIEKIREVLGLPLQPTKEDHKLLSIELSGFPFQESDIPDLILAVRLYVANTLMLEAVPGDSKRRTDLKKIQKMTEKQIKTLGEDIKPLLYQTLRQTTAKLQKIPIDKGGRPRTQIQPKIQPLALLANVYERNIGKRATAYKTTIKNALDFPTFAWEFFSLIGDPPNSEEGFLKLIYRALKDRHAIIPSQVPSTELS